MIGISATMAPPALTPEQPNQEASTAPTAQMGAEKIDISPVEIRSLIPGVRSGTAGPASPQLAVPSVFRFGRAANVRLIHCVINKCPGIRHPSTTASHQQGATLPLHL